MERMRDAIVERRGRVGLGVLAAAVAAAVAGTAAVGAGGPPAYSGVELPPLEGDACWAAGLNARGHVVGSCKDPTLPSFAVLWQNGRATNLAWGVYEADASAINDRGDIVGAVADGGDGSSRAVIWQSERRRKRVALVSRRSSASDVNERGDVAGAISSERDDAFIWTRGRLIRIRASRGSAAGAVAVNERAEVIGWIDRPSKPTRAFFWSRGTLVEIGRGGSPSVAVAINDAGQVIGNSTAPNGRTRAFLWQDGKRIDLGTLGGLKATATAINERGHVVGWSSTRRGDTHAFLWQKGNMRDLGTLGGTTSSAAAINERGQTQGRAPRAPARGARSSGKLANSRPSPRWERSRATKSSTSTNAVKSLPPGH